MDKAGAEVGWQYELIDKLKPGLDLPQLIRSLSMTPTERLETVRRLAQFAEDLRKARAAGRVKDLPDLEAIREIKKRR